MENKYIELYDKLMQLQWLLRRQQMEHYAQYGPTGDPTRGQGRVLAMLRIKPEISTKELTYLLGIRQQSLNELLNKLEKNGFVKRVPSADDKRVMMVILTEKGKEEQSNEMDYESIFDCLDEDEKEKFSEYLDRMIEALGSQIEFDEEELENWENLRNSFMEGGEFPHRGPHRHFFGGGPMRGGRPHGRRNDKRTKNSEENK
ncbi:MarR family winged helix-turn-helix transcriptional regulator [Breznakia pachnodae]|uniref:DNA-binding MarR family transcriptional regulator n=1 Tax=Breznakia pachnodae TaxID=265178 RepID=A0ABU0E570_9FIRM|nr:MarR family transcriptional regulator [Breznakia pachnodae]MDQ0362032.1 DNA-binding MarR family transcriptional regulator [Breznakia pachnodae]